MGLSTTPTQGGAEPRTPNPDANGGLGAKPPDCRQRRQLRQLAAQTNCRGGPLRGPPLDKELYKTLRVRVRVRKKGFGFGFFPNPFFTYAESVYGFRSTFAELISANVAKPPRAGGAEQTRRCREPLRRTAGGSAERGHGGVPRAGSRGRPLARPIRRIGIAGLIPNATFVPCHMAKCLDGHSRPRQRGSGCSVQHQSKKARRRQLDPMPKSRNASWAKGRTSGRTRISTTRCP